MNPMASLLNRTQNNILGMLRAAASGNPQAVFSSMMQSNPQFAQFVQQNRGKSPEQIAREYGVDYNEVKKLIGGSTR